MTAFRELSQHILDICENGVKAGATLVQLNIGEDYRSDHLSIVIRDNGWGMDAEMVQRIADPWITTRTTRKVGLGIPFFKQAAEMCNGAFEITSTVGQGTLTRATFQHSHIDRPPLGDLKATLLCMVVGYAEVDIVYQHQVTLVCGELREFSLDTRELRAVLGDDVPLSDPEVLGFLRATLEEGLQSLYE